MRRVRGVSVLASTAFAVAGLAGCGDSDEAGARSKSTGSGTTATAAAPAQSKHLLIKTHVIRFDGKVLTGSVLGDSAFCAGGSVHHAFGSPDIGFPAINEFSCGRSRLRIGFGPGPDQQNNRIQTSAWRVLDGTGEFANATGSGTMRVVFPVAGSSDAHETFTGTVVLP